MFFSKYFNHRLLESRLKGTMCAIMLQVNQKVSTSQNKTKIILSHCGASRDRPSKIAQPQPHWRPLPQRPQKQTAINTLEIPPKKKTMWIKADNVIMQVML